MTMRPALSSSPSEDRDRAPGRKNIWRDVLTPLAGEVADQPVPRAGAWDPGFCRAVPVAKRLLLLFALVQCPFPLLPAAESDAPAPATNWVLPIFSDKEGYRLMTLRGSEVRPEGKSIAVTNLNITIFSGDAAAQVDSILLGPAAVFVPKENRAYGDKAVRLIRDDIEVTGTGWTFEYDAAVKKVSLQKNVRVTFRAQLNDILK